MKTLEQLEKHKAKVEQCKHKFILCSKLESQDFFGIKQKNYITPLPLNCHSYYCKKCGFVKRMQFRQRVKQNIKKATWYFVTLTSWKKEFTTEQALTQINKSWNAFITTIKIKYPGVQFIKVLEISHRESVHLHVIWNVNVPRARVKRLWERYHNSYIVDVSEKPISHDDIANYLCKYVDKDMQETNSNDWYFIHQKRRYSFSRNMEKIAKIRGYKLMEDFVYTKNQIIELIVQNISGDDWHISDLNLDYLPPPDKRLILDSFCLTN